MNKNVSQKHEDLTELHACALKNEPKTPEIDKLFEDPRFVCGNCGAKTHADKNLCRPEPL